MELQVKKRLKKETSIKKDTTISFIFEFIITSKLLVGKKPPEEIIVIDKLNELNALISKIFSIIKIPNVKKIYKSNILVDCFNVSEVLKAREWIKEQLLRAQVKHHIEAGNYFLLWPNDNVNKVESSLKLAGILVRNMTGKALINGSLRVSIGTTNQMKQFWEKYQEIDQVRALN